MNDTIRFLADGDYQ